MFIELRFPLCSDIPSRPFLRVGAKYRLLGSHPSPELVHDNFEGVYESSVKRLHLSGDSELYRLLCAPDGRGSCTYPNIVVLESNIPCLGDECIDMVRVVKVGSYYYEYIRNVPCVYESFFGEGRMLSGRRRTNPAVCADTRVAVAGEACCEPGKQNTAEPQCTYGGERMKLVTAEQRCSSVGKVLCNYRTFTPTIECPHASFRWINLDCQLKVKVNREGQAAIVHDLAKPHSTLADDTPSFFTVFWHGNQYPQPDQANCGLSSCEVFEDSCICQVEVDNQLVFSQLPQSSSAILQQLTTGHASPEMYDAGEYIESEHGDYKYFTKGSDCCDGSTFFQVRDPVTAKTLYLKNVKSTVSIVDSNFRFRNPPHFNNLIPSEYSISEAHDETVALVDHLFSHPNTAPFLAYRFIQRFGISNPSPRYVEETSKAFTTGRYISPLGYQFGSGQYGDLAATFAAVLLDREARSPLLDVDPAFGSMKEPVLKVLGLMRGMEFGPNIPFLDLFELDEKIGEMAYEQKDVFSFFHPEYSPPGEAMRAELVAPGK